MMMDFLALVGGASLLFVTYAVAQLALALYSKCDAATARTPKLRGDAFANQIVWITGASSGIGKCMALLLAPRGATLILSSRRKEALDVVAKECKELGASNVRILPLDLSDGADVLQAKAKEVGRVDVLINNGGATTRVLAKESSVEVDQYICQVDYLAHVAITKALVASSSPPLRIINIGSVASKVGIPVRTAYCGAKHALLGYMDALRMECLLDDGNTHILNACLGSVKTNVAQNAVIGSSSGKVDTFGQVDPNIENGLDPIFVAERILAVSNQGELPECWLAIAKELFFFYINQYAPRAGVRILAKTLSKQYAVRKEKDE